MNEQTFRKNVKKYLKENMEEKNQPKEKKKFLYSLFTWIYKGQINDEIRNVLKNPELSDLAQEIKLLSDKFAEEVLYQKLKQKFGNEIPKATRIKK